MSLQSDMGHMVAVSGPWSRAEAADFLRSATVPIRIGCRTPADAPWMLSLWYRYTEEGHLQCATAADADVVDFLAHDDAVAFEVSVNEPPYRGVRGNGHAEVTPDEDKAVLRALLERYLDGTDGPLAKRLLRPERAEVTITIVPDRLSTWDYTERMTESA